VPVGNLVALPTVPYAPVYIRALASLIDSVIVYGLQVICLIPVVICYVLFFSHHTVQSGDSGFQVPPFLTIFFWGIYILIICLYYGLMESSSAQATVGKLMVGIKVTDLQGEPLSLPQATGRALGRLVSQAICYIGFLFPLTSEQRQALHDLMAGTIVVASSSQKTGVS
jgi:uncharacterized RDD family membrane protein YckC